MLVSTRRITRMAAAVALALALAGCGPRPGFEPFATYAPGEAAVYGYVTDLFSCGVEGAEVRLPGAGLTSETDTRGRYRFRVEGSASYLLIVEKAGYADDSMTVAVGDQPRRQDFRLVPSGCDGDDCPPPRPPCRRLGD